MMKNTLAYGQTKIDYDLVVMARQSLEIAVHPDQSVVVKAPVNATFEAIEDKIRKKARWIKRQIAYFNQFNPKMPARKYLGGESHLYLGRLYRLKINSADDDHVLLKNGHFQIAARSRDPDHIQKLMAAWYRKRAKAQLSQVFEECWDAFKRDGVTKPHLKIQKMKKRWGSLSCRGQLTLNAGLIQTPKECIEYVVMHELCHLIHRHHGAAFYRLLDQIVPDWAARKHKLEMTLTQGLVL